MSKPLTPSMARQAWLDGALAALRERFIECGYTCPDSVRVSCGFPKGSTGRDKTIGQCWAAEASGDAHNEIFISPELGGAEMGPRIMGVVCHEMVHATVGLSAKHRGPFKRCAVAVGLCGKMTATEETAEFTAWAINVITEQLGEYPAAAMSIHGIKKQATRLLKCVCPECDYPVRVTRKWVEQSGTPICPTDMVSMTCDEVDGEDGE
jgi:hypothetical protein